MKRTATSIWEGTGLDGKGTLSTISGVFKNQPYSHKARFKNDDGTQGTNPEELVAAAHAGCFNMALSFQIDGAGFTAERLETKAKVIMGQTGHDWHFDKIELHLNGKVPGISESEFKSLAEKAKAGCPISQALSAVEIDLYVELA